MKTSDTVGKAEIDDVVAEMQPIENLSDTEVVDKILDRLTDGKPEVE